MSTVSQIEAAVKALPLQEQVLVMERLSQLLKPRAEIPVVPATGHPITQEDIDDAINAD